jgi:maltoporin
LQWQEIGIRPIYYFTDRVQFLFEGGYSHYKDESETVGGVAGAPAVGDRELSRITIGPQLSIKKSIWGRPVMRAFVSHSFWNRNNQSFVAQNAPTFADKMEGTSFGYQFETWF